MDFRNEAPSVESSHSSAAGCQMSPQPLTRDLAHDLEKVRDTMAPNMATANTKNKVLPKEVIYIVYSLSSINFYFYLAEFYKIFISNSSSFILEHFVIYD